MSEAEPAPLPDQPLLATIADRAGAAEQARELTADTVAGLREAGLFRLLVPEALGGLQVTPAEYFAAVERIARADGAAGWCVAVGSTAGLALAYIDPAEAESIADPEAIHCGVFASRVEAEETLEGLNLSGRWSLASGVRHSDWIGLGCRVEAGAYRYALLPAAEVEVIDSWDSLGLRASGSHDVEVADQLVARERVADLIVGEPTTGGALYAFPMFGLLAMGIAAVCAGIARCALDQAIELAGSRRPAASSRSLAERATTQDRVARAHASLGAATALAREAIATAWDQAQARGEIDIEARNGLRLAASHLATSAVGVVDGAHSLSGSAGIYRGSVIERCQRDIHTATQHMIIAPATYELSGRLLLGLDTDTSQL